MKRLLLFCLSLVAVFLVLPSSAHAAVNNFVITNYSIDYHLSKDSAGRSILLTKETITANFPVYAQNHGIERAIPQSYDGHPTSLSVGSVTNESGAKLTYTTYSSNGNEVVRIGDADRYVHGLQTYVLTYTQRDVTKYFADTGRDEFYWDTNGTEWLVPIDNLTVNLTLDPSIQTALTGDTACYQGPAGATVPCSIVRDDSGYHVSTANLSFSENATIVIGFKTGTFEPYQKTLFEKLIIWILIGWVVALPLIVIGTILIIVRYYRWTRRSNERQTVVTEYLPPKDTSVTTAAAIIAKGRSVFTAQLLDFAVRHYTKIIETRPKSFWRRAEYDIEIIKDISSLRAEEQEILKDIFGETSVGQRLVLKSLQNNTTVYSRMQNNDKKLRDLMRGQYGLTAKDSAKSAWLKKLGLTLLVLSVPLLNPALLILAIGVLIASYTLWPLTDKGLELARYLDGLKQYIKVAEVERLKMLQSPEGALKIGDVDVKDDGQLVKLYEEVLPYATLFGLEKEWNQRIGQYYESIGKSPEWYAGHGAFNAAVFSNSMTNFSSAASYTSASSSSSGGSSGGGSSGGGGGGGGGGGW